MILDAWPFLDAAWCIPVQRETPKNDLLAQGFFAFGLFVQSSFRDMWCGLPRAGARPTSESMPYVTDRPLSFCPFSFCMPKDPRIIQQLRRLEYTDG